MPANSPAQPPLPPELVEGLLHQGSKMSLGGASKAYKSWALLDLALSVGYGMPWLGCQAVRSRVLVINMEIQQAFCRKRIITLAEARGIRQEPTRVDVWNLRGYATSHKEIFPKIVQRVGEGNYGLIVLDPIYKLYGDADENSASDVAALLNSMEAIAEQTKAAVAFGTHFSKGNQSGKNAIDRVSGSGVFARDPDTLLTLTAHEEPNCFTLDATLRNLPPMDPFVVRWDYPLFVRDGGLDPAKLKTVGRPSTYTADALLAVLGDNVMGRDGLDAPLPDARKTSITGCVQCWSRLEGSSKTRKSGGSRPASSAVHFRYSVNCFRGLRNSGNGKVSGFLVFRKPYPEEGNPSRAVVIARRVDFR